MVSFIDYQHLQQQHQTYLATTISSLTTLATQTTSFPKLGIFLLSVSTCLISIVRICSVSPCNVLITFSVCFISRTRPNIIVPTDFECWTSHSPTKRPPLEWLTFGFQEGFSNSILGCFPSFFWLPPLLIQGLGPKFRRITFSFPSYVFFALF